MPKKSVTGGLISPTQLWGKPLRTAQPAQSTSARTADEDVMDDEEIDVDAELAEEDAPDAELREVEAEENSGESDDVDNEDENSEDDEPDYDAEEGDVSDENEDAVEDGEEVVTAVDDDNEVGDDENVPATTGKGSMSEKMSLSDHVRAEITRRQKSGDSLRGKDIVDSLSKKKIKVSPAQVSQLLKKAGLGGKTRGKKAAAVAAAGTDKNRVAHKAAPRDVSPSATPAKQPPKMAAKKPAATTGFKVPMAQLEAASSFVDACGGSFADAQRILTAAEQLAQAFSG